MIGQEPALRPFVLALLLALVAARAAAETPLELARHHFYDGKAAFALGDYQRAYEAFRRAQLTAPEPAFLYNMASAQIGMQRPHDAAETLRAYLRALPDDPERAEIETRIRTLEESQRLLDEKQPAPPMVAPRLATPAGAAADETPAPRRRLWIAIVAAVAAVVAVGIGVAIAVAVSPRDPAIPSSFGGNMMVTFP